VLHPPIALQAHAGKSQRAATAPILQVDPSAFRGAFNRRSFAFAHTLAGNPLFTLPRLAQLAGRMLAAGDEKKFVALGGESASVASGFNALPRAQRLTSTIEALPTGRSWVKLSSADVFDPDYRAVLEQILAELAELSGSALKDQITWSTLTVFLASPGIVTPYHIDHESNFLLQIAGEKDLFLFDGGDRTVLTEQEIECFYAGDFQAARYRAELQPRASAYRLVPGVVAHHPPLAPHWVQNGTAVSVSVSIGFCMHPLDRRARVYQVNHYLRRLGLTPTAPGRSAVRDSLKSGALGLLSNRRPTTPDEIIHSGLNRLRRLGAPVSRVRRALRGRAG